MGISAYDVANDISKCGSNLDRGKFVEGLMRDVSSGLDREVYVQELNGDRVNSEYGVENLFLKSDAENPILLVAHYDAYLEKGNGIPPGANDNGSGIGACLESLTELKNLPVDVAFFAGEEWGMYGSLDYCSEVIHSKNEPKLVCCLDMCGVGDTLYVSETTSYNCSDKKIDKGLNERILSLAQDSYFKTSNNLIESGSDHFSFLKREIPASMITVKDSEGEMERFYHSKKDVIDHIDRDTLNFVSDVVVGAVRSYFVN